VDLGARYKEYEERAYRRIVGLIETIPPVSAPVRETGVPALRREMFQVFLDKVYKRSK